jgi:hypothetical protein
LRWRRRGAHITLGLTHSSTAPDLSAARRHHVACEFVRRENGAADEVARHEPTISQCPVAIINTTLRDALVWSRTRPSATQHYAAEVLGYIAWWLVDPSARIGVDEAKAKPGADRWVWQDWRGLPEQVV